MTIDYNPAPISGIIIYSLFIFIGYIVLIYSLTTKTDISLDEEETPLAVKETQDNISIWQLLFNLIVHPKKAMAEAMIESYDLDRLNIYFYVVSAIMVALNGCIESGEINLVVIIVSAVAAPLGMILAKWLAWMLDTLLYRKVLKIKLSNNRGKKIFLAVYAASYSVRSVLELLCSLGFMGLKNDIINSVIEALIPEIILMLWLAYVHYLLIQHFYGRSQSESKKKAILFTVANIIIFVSIILLFALPII